MGACAISSRRIPEPANPCFSRLNQGILIVLSDESLVRQLRLGMQLGLFQLSFGLLGVLILGLLNRLLIQDIQLPAVLAALAVGAQQLMGFTRIWFGHRSDQMPSGRLRRTPFILASSCALALLFPLAVRVVLQLTRSMELQGLLPSLPWVGALVLIFIAIGTAIAAGGTAFSALVADRTTEKERPRVLSVVFAMRLLGVLLGSALVNQVFGTACAIGASRSEVWAGLERLGVMAPVLLLGLGVASVVGVERWLARPVAVAPGMEPAAPPQRMAPIQLLNRLRSIPQAGRFMAVLCLFTFSMFLNDAILEPYGAAVFGMSVCDTTALNALVAAGFFVGLLVSGFQLIERFGNIRTAQLGAGFAVLALLLLVLAAPLASTALLRVAVGGFGFALGVCMNSCLTLMFSFVEPGRTGFLLGIWGAGYAYSCGLATISGGGLLSLFGGGVGDEAFGAYTGVFALQIVCFAAAATMTQRLNVLAFRQRVRVRFGELMAQAAD